MEWLWWLILAVLFVAAAWIVSAQVENHVWRKHFAKRERSWKNLEEARMQLIRMTLDDMEYTGTGDPKTVRNMRHALEDILR